LDISRESGVEATPSPAPPSIYANPRVVTDVRACYFYHTMDLPGVGTINGDWDLRPNIKNYLGGVDFAGKRALDIGCANGVLSFYMERQGANVVSFDLDKNQDWDVVPFAKWAELEHRGGLTKNLIDQINRGYWLAHRLLGSKAQVVYGRVYAIPDAIGAVDIVVLGSILLHLRDPFLALQNALRLCEHTAIIADLYHRHDQESPGPFLEFLPDAKTVESVDTWWSIRPEWVVRAIGVLGFENAKVTYHTQRFQGRDIKLFTVVGQRTHGQVDVAKESRVDAGPDAWIESVESPNWIDSAEGKNLLWIGDQPTRFVIFSRKEASSLLYSEGVLMGPSVRRDDSRRLCVRSETGERELDIRDRFSVELQLHPGTNVVELWCKDKPDILTQPNGDTRILLLGVLNYHLGLGEPLS